MREFLHKFKVWDMDRNDEWLDISFTDTSPKASLREWRFSYNTKDHKYYAVLYRAKDDEAPFDRSIDLPKAMTDKLWFLVAPQITMWRLTR